MSIFKLDRISLKIWFQAVNAVNAVNEAQPQPHGTRKRQGCQSLQVTYLRESIASVPE